MILSKLFARRRLLSKESPCASEPCGECFSIHEEKARACIAKGDPIHFVLPAFPAKSPNLKKVFGRRPDYAEKIALRALNNLCNEFGNAYLTICTDGRVFGDLIHVSDEDILEYQSDLQKIIVDEGLDSLRIFSFHGSHTELTQGTLIQAEQVREKSRNDFAALSLFNGIHRFIFEDRMEIFPDRSRNRNRKDAKPIAYQLIARSNAWSAVIENQFPEAIRLSIHPQPVHSNKVGIYFSDELEPWTTPWHGVALVEGCRVAFVKRKFAENLGAELVVIDGFPSHYELKNSHSFLRDFNQVTPSIGQ